MNTHKWVTWSIASFFFVSVLGVLMRYKIAFDFPFFNQKFLQHAHSHFAFIGWISQGIYILFIQELGKRSEESIIKYKPLLGINLLLAVLLCIAFLYGGYFWLSIALSTLSIGVSLVFSIWYIKDLQKTSSNQVDLWFYASLLFNAISILGTVMLSYLMITRSGSQEKTLGSIYFYLHFQYNGWFLFALLGYFFSRLKFQLPLKIANGFFYVFFVSTFLNYFLSILWLDFSKTLTFLVVISACAQFISWCVVSIPFRKVEIFNKAEQWFLRLIWAAFTLKLLLQLGSLFPYVSHLAYSLRSIVIAYLHLSLLVITSSYLLFELLKISNHTLSRYFYIFFALVILNEIALATQGFAGIFYVLVPGLQPILLIIAVSISLSLLFVLWSHKKHKI